MARVSAIAFDTHRAVKTPCETGAAEPLTEAFVETIGGNVSTKADIIASETTLRAEIAESEARVQVKIAEVHAETKADIAGARAEVAEVRTEVAEVRTEVAEVRTEVANVRAELKTDIGLVQAGIGDLEGRLYRQLWIMAGRYRRAHRRAGQATRLTGGLARQPRSEIALALGVMIDALVSPTACRIRLVLLPAKRHASLARRRP